MDEFEEIFDFDPLHRIIPCNKCRYAVVPIQVETQLTRKHSRLSKSQRRSIIAVVDGLLRLAHRESDVVFPDPYI
jgi:hypothetical protein